MWHLRSKPYVVQTEALRACADARGFGYFLEMGLGKTAVILAEALDLHHRGKLNGVLVICPNSLKQNWIDEAEKMGAEFNSVAAWPGIADRTVAPWLQIMNYEAVITNRGSASLIAALRSGLVMLVADESIAIKNPKARRTRVLITAAQLAVYRRALSGQPIVQGPHDLWAQLRFIGELSGFNYFAFRNTFCKMGGYLGRQVVGTMNEERLTRLLRDCSFRARKEDWLDLPSKIYTTRNIELTRQQLHHYKEMKEFLITMIDTQEFEAQMVITQMLKLQQITSGFIIGADHKPVEIPGGDPKLETLGEILEEVTGKTLVFTHFRATTEKVHAYLTKQGYNPVMMYGEMTPTQIGIAKERFEQDASCRVFVVQTQTGKYGHTLLGGTGDDRCATTIFYEHSFSLDARVQAEDRNHRIGQDKPVVYIDFVSSPIDKLAVAALLRKQDVASAIVDGLRSNRDPVRKKRA